MTAPKTTLMALMIALMTGASGCQMADFVADVVTGGGTLPAAYVLPEKPTVIFIDDPKKKLTTHDLAGRLATSIGLALTDHNVVPQVISPELVMQTRDANPDFAKWAIAKIGREVGAKQVIYVLVTRYSLTEDGQIYRPIAEARVKVVDVDTGLRLFPKAPEAGYGVLTELAYGDLTGGGSTTHTIIGRNLADQLAHDVSILFYEHRKPQRGDKLPG